MPWIIKAYIPVECDEPEIYPSKEEAEKDLESLSLMQPENRRSRTNLMFGKEDCDAKIRCKTLLHRLCHEDCRS